MAAEVGWKEALAQGKPLPSRLILAPELLEEIGIGPRRLPTVIANLSERGRETVGNLLDVKTEAKAIELAGDEVSGERLWSFIQKQKQAEERLTSAQGRKFPPIEDCQALTQQEQ
jgi:hypothetical protein